MAQRRTKVFFDYKLHGLAFTFAGEGPEQSPLDKKIFRERKASLVARRSDFNKFIRTTTKSHEGIARSFTSLQDIN